MSGNKFGSVKSNSKGRKKYPKSKMVKMAVASRKRRAQS